MANPPIRASTRLIDALSDDPELLERLARFDPAFAKLRTVLPKRAIRQLLTFSDAAAIAGVAVDVLLSVANGTSVTVSTIRKPLSPTPDPAPPARPDVDPGTPAPIEVDVRPTLAAGDDPLALIMEKAQLIAPGGLLIIHAPFDPMPLRRLLGGRGFTSSGVPVGPGHWRVEFRRATVLPRTQAARTLPRLWTEGRSLHVDVRALPPTASHRAVLAALAEIPAGGRMIVHHDRGPDWLIAELAAERWIAEQVAGDPGEVRLLVVRGFDE